MQDITLTNNAGLPNQLESGKESLSKQQANLIAGTPTSPMQLAKRPNNTGLPDQLKSGIETLSGMEMDHVRVHYNSDRPAQLQAHAYAQGSEIHVAPGQEHHVPHEAWHVVQQAQGRVRPTIQMKDGPRINDDTRLESEADMMGARALVNAEKLVGYRAMMAPPTSPGKTIQAAFQYVYPANVLVDKGRPIDDIKHFHARQNNDSAATWSRDGVQIYTENRNRAQVESLTTKGPARTSNLVQVSDEMQWALSPGTFNALKAKGFLGMSGASRFKIFNQAFAAESSSADDLKLPLHASDNSLDKTSANANTLWWALRHRRRIEADLTGDPVENLRGDASEQVTTMHANWDAVEAPQGTQAWLKIRAQVSTLAAGRNPIYLPMLSVLVNELQARGTKTIYVSALVNAIGQLISAGITKQLPRQIGRADRTGDDDKRQWGQITGMKAASEAFHAFLPQIEAKFLQDTHAGQLGSSASYESKVAKGLWAKMNVPGDGREYYPLCQTS